MNKSSWSKLGDRLVDIAAFVVVLASLLILLTGLFSAFDIISSVKMQEFKDSNIIGTYIKNPDTSKSVIVNYEGKLDTRLMKFKTISKSKKSLSYTSNDFVSIFTIRNIKSVDNIKVKGLYGDNYYVTKVDKATNSDGATYNIVELSHIKAKSLKSLGLKADKVIPYNYPLEDVKVGSKLSLNSEGRLEKSSKDVKEKVINYPVPKYTYFKYRKLPISEVFDAMLTFIAVLLVLAILAFKIFIVLFPFYYILKKIDRFLFGK